MAANLDTSLEYVSGRPAATVYQDAKFRAVVHHYCSGRANRKTDTLPCRLGNQSTAAAKHPVTGLYLKLHRGLQHHPRTSSEADLSKTSQQSPGSGTHTAAHGHGCVALRPHNIDRIRQCGDDWQSEEICSANTPDLLAAAQNALDQLRRGGPRWTIEEALANALARAKAQGSVS